MKRLKLLLLLMLTLSAITLVSCKDKGGASNNNNGQSFGGETEEKENLIYDTSSELYVIIGSSVNLEYADSIFNELSYFKSEKLPTLAPDSSAPHKHEIVLGATDRDISVTAISKLDRVAKNSDDELAFLVYSNGSSVAVVWEEGENDEDGVMAEIALKYFLDNYVKEELTLSSGVVYSDAVDIIEDYYRKKDEEYRKNRWESFEKTYGKELSDAYKALYSIYSADSVVWLANLYDPDICVCADLYGEDECKKTKYCGTGGFYFSNSARDTTGYLPDAESTGQAIGLLQILGLAYNRGGDAYYGVLTEEMRQAIGDFAYALEEPNGYFYHPQWSFELVDSLPSRRSRDMSHCVGILQSLGRKPKYTTASGVLGEDALGTAAILTERLCGSTVSAVSKAILVSDSSYDKNLEDLESFKQYIATLDIKTEYNSYSIGNTLTAMSAEIKERDRQIGTPEDPTPLMDHLIGWLNENQNPKNGTWAYIEPSDPKYDPYMATNGLLKVSGIYKAAERVMPYAKEAADSCMTAIMNPSPADRATDIYNLWYALINITDNLKAYGGAEGVSLANEIVTEMRAVSAEAILLTREKIIGFVREDGSGSYYKDQSCPVSQGAPVALPGPVEGDVNGTTIIIGQMTDLIANALDIPRIPTFGEAERAIFRNIVKDIGSVTKLTEPIPEVFDFESDMLGDAPEQFTVSGAATAVVKADPTGSDKGNLLHLSSVSGVTQTVDIPVRNSSSNTGVYVFETDLMLNSAEGSYIQQISLGSCYMLTLRKLNDRLELWESSSQTNVYAVEEFLGIVIEPEKWARLRVEYYTGDHDSVRIKVYADTDLSDGEDMKLYAVTDNYYDMGGVKISKGEGTPSVGFTKATLLTLNSASADIYLDNVNAYKTRLKYEMPRTDETPFINIDPPTVERVDYTFEGEELDEGLIGEGDIALSDGTLLFDGALGGSLKAPLTVRCAGAKCAEIGFELTLLDGNTSEAVTLRATDGEKAMFDLLLTLEEDTKGKYLSLTPKGAALGEKVKGFRLPVGEVANIKIEYYHDEDIIIVYLDGSFAYSGSTLYSGGEKARMDGFCISTAPSSGISLKIDDLYSEMNTTDFEDTVNSRLPSKIYEFNEEEKGVTLSGKETVITSIGSDGVVEMDSSKYNGSVSVSVNKRSPITNKATLKFDLDYITAPKNGVTHFIALQSPEGDVILQFAIKTNGEKAELYEVGKGGILTTPLYIYTKESTITVELEFFPEEKTSYVLHGGKRVAKSGVVLGSEHLESELMTATIRSGEVGCSAAFDDIRFETLYEEFTNENINSSSNTETDIASGIDFESSNSGNIPTFIKSELIGSAASVGITNLYNNVKDEYSNVLSFKTAAGANDKINIVRPEGSGGSAIAFEADICLDLGYEGYVYQMFFSDIPNGNNAYLIQFENRGGKIKITDNSNSNNNSPGARNLPLYEGINMGEWFNLRVEYYKASTADALRIKVFINGSLVKVSDNFYGSEKPGATPSGRIDNVSFYSFLNNVGTLYIDNLKFVDFNGSCTDSVG